MNYSNDRNTKRKILIIYIEILIIALILASVATIVVICTNAFSKDVPITVDINNTEQTIKPTETRKIAEDGRSITEIPTAVKSDLSEPISLNKYVIPMPKAYVAYDDVYTSFIEDTPDYKNNAEKIIVLDPGHQYTEDSTKYDIWISPYMNPSNQSSVIKNHLPNTGAKGVASNKSEYEINLSIARKLKTELEARGYTVYLTRDGNNTLLHDAQRAAVANKYDTDLMISIHCNYDADSAVKSGTYSIVPKVWDGYPDKNLAYLSYKAAAIITASYSDISGMTNLGICETENAPLFSFCKVPSFIIELGYLSNSADDKNINNTEFQSSMIIGICDGIDKYFGLLTNQ